MWRQSVSSALCRARFSSNVEYISKSVPVVVLDFNELVLNKPMNEAISAAYGYDGIGVLAVKNVPKMKDFREKLLPMAFKFANLPESVQRKYEHPSSHYSFGWSRGKEMMSEGKPDFSKGSYYNNPTYDVPFSDPEIISKYPSFCSPNIWPKDDMPELEGAFKHLSTLVVQVGELVARVADSYVSSVLKTDFHKLHSTISSSRVNKARLLHYYPTDTKPKATVELSDFDSWCGWHNDHGTLTGLVPNMYHDISGTKIKSPDPNAGLYIRARSGKMIHVTLPEDYLAFQIGETAQVHTGGILLATPHGVRAAAAPGVSRSTLAVFMEPEMSEPMNIPVNIPESKVTEGATLKLLPKGVPPLGSRWNSKQSFAEFTDATLKSYYGY